jgi:glycosyltransferase involved in cell wall biosynthesis
VEPSREITETSKSIRHKYVIVSPVRDEEKYVEDTILSVARQTIRPAEWIIVDDGSRDRTREIIDRYSREHAWIRVVHRTDRGQRIPGAGVMEAFHDGFHRLASGDWEFIAKLDGDVLLEPDYFERCFERFDVDPTLGMCGGMMYCIVDGDLKLESHPIFHVRGPIKLYRRACWEAIGGLIKAAGWDTVDEVQANRLGWHTRSFPDLRVIHLRPTGAVQGYWRDGVKMGKAAYIAGYHPIFMLAKCVKRLFQRPYVLCAIAHGYGYASSLLTRVPRVEDRALIQYIRHQQMRRLFFLKSMWK